MWRCRWLGAVVAALILAVTAGWAGAAHAQPAAGPIVSRWSNKCIDIRRQDGTGDGALAQQWDCTSTPEQQFSKIQLKGDSDFLLQNPHSGRCLRPSGGSTDANALIEQYNCYPIFDPNNPGKYRDPSQHWQTYDPGGNSTGAKWLINLESGKCVEDSAWGTANGVLLTQQDCVGAWKQYWFGL